jgi:phosphocarrier protein
MESGDGSSPQTAKGTFEIINQLGLHARAAAQLVNIANRYKSEITIRRGLEAANGKSIMGVLMLAAAVGSKVTIEAEGPDSGEAVARIGELIANRFGEEE